MRCSAPCPLYVSVEGVEVLAGVSTFHEIDLSTAVTWHIDAAQGVRVFYYCPHSSSVEPDGEVFTNIDMMPQESGSILEVKKALRLFKLEQQAGLREIHQAAETLRQERAEFIASRETADTEAEVIEAATTEDASE